MLPMLMKANGARFPILFFGESHPGGALGGSARPTVWRYRGIGQAAEVRYFASTFTGFFQRPVVVKSGNTRRIFTSVQSGNLQGPYLPPNGYSWVNFCYSDDEFETAPIFVFYQVRTGASPTLTSIGLQMMSLPGTTSLRAFAPYPYTYTPPTAVSPTYQRVTISFSGNAVVEELGQYPGQFGVGNIFCGQNPPYTFTQVSKYVEDPDQFILRVGNGAGSIVLELPLTAEGGWALFGVNYAWDQKTGTGVIPLTTTGTSFTNYYKPMLRFTGSTPSAQSTSGWPYGAGVNGRGKDVRCVAAGDGNFLAMCPEPSSALANGDILHSTNGQSWTIRNASAMAAPDWAGYCKTTKEFFFQASGTVLVTSDLGYNFTGIGLPIPAPGGSTSPRVLGFTE